MAVVILPGVEVDLGDGDGVAGHDGVAEIVKFVSNIFKKCSKNERSNRRKRLRFFF